MASVSVAPGFWRADRHICAQQPSGTPNDFAEVSGNAPLGADGDDVVVEEDGRHLQSIQRVACHDAKTDFTSVSSSDGRLTTGRRMDATR